VGGQVQLQWLANSTSADISNAAAIKLLADFATWGPTTDNARSGGPRSKALQALFNRRPALLTKAVAATPLLAVPAAGNRFLGDPTARAIAHQACSSGSGTLRAYFYALLALVANPVVDPAICRELVASLKATFAATNDYTANEVIQGANRRLAKHDYAVTEPFESVNDADALAWLVSRCSANRETGRTRPFDLAALSANPNLDPAQVTWISQALSAWYTRQVLSDAEFDVALAAFEVNYADAATNSFTPPREYPAPRTYAQELVLPPDISNWSLKQRPSEAVAPYLGQYAADHLGTNSQAWLTMFSLAKDFDGPYTELIEVALAVTA
jgi:hypothetical protein